MASVTKFYPAANTAPYEPATWRGSWTSHANQTFTLSDDKTGARVGPLGHSGVAGSNKLGIARFISNPLSSQTISGTLDMAINVQESNLDANFFTKIYVYVTQGDTDTPRGTLLDFADTSGTEWLTTSFGKVYGLSSPQTLSSLAVSAGDRIVIEFGVSAVAGSGSSRTATAWFGATARLLTGAIITDAVVGDTGTGTTSAGYIVFSNAITVQRPDAASGDLLAGNGLLYLYDGTTGALKRRILPIGSEDPAGGAQLQSNGTLYVSYESLNATDDIENGQVAMYDPTTLAYSGLFQVFPGVGPHSIAANTSDEVLLGCIGDGTTQASCGEASQGGPSAPVTAASAYIRKFDSAGSLLDTYAAALGASGTNSIDLAQDNETVYYTSLDRVIRRYNVVTDSQGSTFYTLPAATAGEMARGLRILSDGSVLVADVVDVKRIAADGSGIVQTYSVAAQADWGTLALSPDGSEFWVANRADSAVSPAMIAKFDVASGDLLLSITQDDVSLPDTGGGMCSGGITCMNGFRAAFAACVSPAITVQPISQTIIVPTVVVLSVTATGDAPITYQWYRGASGDTSDPITGETSATYTASDIVADSSFWVQVTNACSSSDSATAVITVTMPTPGDFATVADPIRWLRIPPTIFSDGKRVRHTRLQVDMEVGVGLSVASDEQDYNPIILVRSSDDNAKTWSSFRQMNMGRQGQYSYIARLFQLGAAYNRVYEFSGDSPVPFCLVQAFIDLEGWEH